MEVLFCDNQALSFTALPSEVWLKGKFSLILTCSQPLGQSLGEELGISKAVEVLNWAVWLASPCAAVKACRWPAWHFSLHSANTDPTVVTGSAFSWPSAARGLRPISDSRGGLSHCDQCVTLMDILSNQRWPDFKQSLPFNVNLTCAMLGNKFCTICTVSLLYMQASQSFVGQARTYSDIFMNDSEWEVFWIQLNDKSFHFERFIWQDYVCISFMVCKKTIN